MAFTFTPYTTARTFNEVLPSWLSEQDAERLNAYNTYEAIYKNIPETFKFVMRGTEDDPIYVPTAKTIIEATNRFLAKRWNYAVNPEVGTPQEQEIVSTFIRNLFKREEMYAKFATNRRWGLVRGDAIWHIVADDTKPEGTRISIYDVDPSTYFPIDDPNDPEKIIGCHIADQYIADDDRVILRRHTYRKEEDGIWTQLAFFELEKWDDRLGQEVKKVAPPAAVRNNQAELLEGFYLPPEITAIPVYHVKNGRETGNPFGVSEIQGIERLMTGINQTISDAELAMSLDGLGMYVTSSRPPLDENGEETRWRIRPGGVVEVDNAADWKRVQGVSNLVGVNLTDWLTSAAREASGVPDIAIGTVDSSIAESGISLALKMSPLLSKNEEKEATILGIMDHLLHDLVNMWMPVFEGTPAGLEVFSIVDDPMPVNREARLNEIYRLVELDIVSRDWARNQLAMIAGYDFEDGMMDTIVAEKSYLAESDSFSMGINQVLNDN